MYFALIVVCVSRCRCLVIVWFFICHTLMLLLRFSPSFSHSSLTSPRIYYARILRAACSNLLLYCCLPWGRVRRGNWVFMRRWLLHISLSLTRTHTHIEQCDMQYWCASHWRFRFEVVFVLLVLLAWSLKLSQFAHEIYSVKLTKTCPESQMQYIILWKCILPLRLLCHRRCCCSCNSFVYFTFSFTIAIVYFGSFFLALNILHLILMATCEWAINGSLDKRCASPRCACCCCCCCWPRCVLIRAAP